MRLTSDFFAGALVRRAFGEGCFAAVMRKGAKEAGAIFVVIDRLDGTKDLYGPAPQAMFMEETEGADAKDGRLFECRIAQGDIFAVQEVLDREARMDPDFWVIEIEDREGRCFLSLASED